MWSKGLPLYRHAVMHGLRTIGRVLLSADIAGIHQTDLPDGVLLCPRPISLTQNDTPMSLVTLLIGLWWRIGRPLYRCIRAYS
jgi:hypothetical protein